MKKRMLFGSAALTFAFVSAFAMKSNPLVENPSYVNSVGECQPVEVQCNGTAQPCSRDLGGTIGTKPIVQFVQETSCSERLKMNN